jgi:hypothetical protein
MACSHLSTKTLGHGLVSATRHHQDRFNDRAAVVHSVSSGAPTPDFGCGGINKLQPASEASKDRIPA